MTSKVYLFSFHPRQSFPLFLSGRLSYQDWSHHFWIKTICRSSTYTKINNLPPLGSMFYSWICIAQIKNKKKMLFFCIHYLDIVARVGMGLKKKATTKNRTSCNKQQIIRWTSNTEYWVTDLKHVYPIFSHTESPQGSTPFQRWKLCNHSFSLNRPTIVLHPTRATLLLSSSLCSRATVI